MPYRPKLLILTCKTGGGHVSLAEALRDQLQNDTL
jgi:UDP-N-acetylglucosamine:LPS N-acetylglucosamine transferase